MDQIQDQGGSEPCEYEWAEFNLPAELRDSDTATVQAAAPSSSANAD